MEKEVQVVLDVAFKLLGLGFYQGRFTYGMG